MARRSACSLVAFVLCACGASQPKAEGPAPRPQSAQEASASEPARSVLVARPAPRACSAPAAVPDRDTAIELLLHGRALDAGAALETLLAARPWDVAAASFYGASLAVARDDNQAAAGVANRVPVVALAAPTLALPSAAAPVAPVATSPTSAPTTRLRQLSVQRNLITDDADWLAAHPPADTSGASHPPSHVAASFQGRELQQLFIHADHAVALYAGSILVCSAQGKQPRAFSLSLPPEPSTNAPPLELTGARLVGESLLVTLAYNGYASLSSGRTGYLLAFDARDGRVRWVSPPLSANAGNFVVLGHTVITGYGFTAEPDFVFTFDLESGAVLQKLPVKSGPDVFTVERQRLFVRTYDMDYTFAIEGSSVPPIEAPALAAAEPRAEAPLDPNTLCHAKAAAAAIDARDPAALEQAVAGLQADGRLSPWIETVMRAAITFVRDLRERRSVDLWSSPPVVVAPPPWQRSVSVPSVTPHEGPAPKLVRLRAVAASPVRGPDPPPFRADQPYFIAPIDEGRLPPGAPDVPTHYGLASLGAIIPSGERTLLIYAGRYLFVLRGASVEQRLDLGALRDPPKANPQWKEFASQDASHAQVVGDTLYVCNGGGSYAREVFGKKGFVTALELATGALRWRSDALRCNATLTIAGDLLVTGYGFTDEPDFLFVLRLSDGETLAKAKLDSGPDTITLDGGQIHVEAYAHAYDFALE